MIAPTWLHNRYGYSYKFSELMEARMRTSHYKYGDLDKSYPFPANAMASLEVRLQLYRDTGNVEWLIDVANFAMIEALYPAHPNAHFRPTSSDESPGLVKDTNYDTSSD